MVIAIFAETDEIFLFGLAIPLYDALVLGAGVDMLRGHLEGGYAKFVAFVLDGFFIGERGEGEGDVLEEFVLLAQLILAKAGTYYWRRSSAY